MKQLARVSALTLLVVFFGLCGGDTADAMTLSPVRVELSGDPGQTVTGEIEVFNEEATDKTFYASYENFEPSGEDGSPKFVGGGSGLASWVTTQPSLSLGANEKRTIPFTVTIPDTAEPGGYFAAVFFGSQNPENLSGGEVSVGGRLGVLILLTVRGEIVEDAGITDFTLLEGRVHTLVPVTFTYRVANNGADRVVPVGDIRVTNTFGMTTVTLPANEREGSVLPGSARRYQVLWAGPEKPAGFFEAVKQEFGNLHIGWYTAHARIAWGGEQDVSSARYDFFLIPWEFLTVAFIVVLFLAFLVRRYNTWIIARARSNS